MVVIVRVNQEVRVSSDKTCGNLEQVLKRVVTPWQVTSRFPGLSLRNLSIGLGIGVDTSFVCRVSSPIFRRSHIRCRHLLQSEAEEVESCSGLYSVLRVRVERHGRRDVLHGVGRGVRE